ncbi:hypothetical protein [Halobaculum marinum]|uniref:Uncharacterized protein n=1 Tax=Halobaculum marinum TaxID=3031996 RepID=A0ABD5WWJ9_9EURY|nr:hypothetical protein [Halobaculum sp. DT55]
MSRRATPRPDTTPTRTPFTRPGQETDAPLVPDLGTRPGRTDTTTDPTTDTTSDRAERRRRRDPFELALMEDSE